MDTYKAKVIAHKNIIGFMIIKYYSKNVYGKKMYYIIDKIQTKLYKILTGDKTLTDSKIFALKAFGVKLEEVLPPKK